MNHKMKFSWKGVILAPLPLPLIFSFMLSFFSPGRSPLFSFLFFFIIGAVISYGTMLFIFLPCLFLISIFKSLTASITCLVGIVLGFIVYILISWQSYISSGVDSGPPVGTFQNYLMHHLFEWDFWFIISAGLITALVYWYLSNHSTVENNHSD